MWYAYLYWSMWYAYLYWSMWCAYLYWCVTQCGMHMYIDVSLWYAMITAVCVLMCHRRVTTDTGRNKLSKYKHKSSKQKCNISEYNVYVGMYIDVSLWYACWCVTGVLRRIEDEISRCGVMAPTSTNSQRVSSLVIYMVNIVASCFLRISQCDEVSA